jgi:hypothetical protein
MSTLTALKLSASTSTPTATSAPAPALPPLVEIDGLEIPRLLYLWAKQRARLSGQTQFIGVTSKGRLIAGMDREELHAHEWAREGEWLRGIAWISPYDKLDLMRPEVMA